MRRVVQDERRPARSSVNQDICKDERRLRGATSRNTARPCDRATAIPKSGSLLLRELLRQLPHASISVRREYPPLPPVMLTRMRSVVVAVNETWRLTRLLPATLPSVTQAAPFQLCTWKSVTPYAVNVSVLGGSTGKP